MFWRCRCTVDRAGCSISGQHCTKRDFKYLQFERPPCLSEFKLRTGSNLPLLKLGVEAFSTSLAQVWVKSWL